MCERFKLPKSVKEQLRRVIEIGEKVKHCIASL